VKIYSSPASDRTSAALAGVLSRDVIIFEEKKLLGKLVDPYVMFSSNDMRNRIYDRPCI